MNEISIQLTEVNPTIFYGGSKSKNIAILKKYFPKIKIVARGETITAYGEEEILEEFEKQMDRLIMHYGKYNSLDEDTVEKILTSSIEDNFGLDDTDVQKISAWCWWESHQSSNSQPSTIGRINSDK